MFAGLVTACRPPAPPPPPIAPVVAPPPPAKPAQPTKEELVLIEPGGPTPPFVLAQEGGASVASSTLIGQVPFVVIFFSMTCQVCARKWPMIQEALARAGGDVKVIAVSMDDEPLWPLVPDYVKNRGVDATVVRAADNPRFSLSYNPLGGFPALIVVGRSGRVVEMQGGLRKDHAARLGDALGRAMDR